MSRLTELLRQARKADPQLGADLEAEISALTKRRTFGLVFEQHQPEAVELPGRAVRRGDKVRVLPPRGSRCDPGCANGARTDTHVARLNDERAWHEQQADTSSTPEPLRQRHQQRAAALQLLIAEHQATRQSPPPHCSSARTDHHPDEPHPTTTTSTEGL